MTDTLYQTYCLGPDSDCGSIEAECGVVIFVNVFSTFKHLFSRSQAWRLVANPIRDYIKGFSSFPVDIRNFIDKIWLDIFPSKTRELSKWGQQFDLTQSGSASERTTNLDGRWKAQGGQGFDYLQDLIQASGYPQVFLHQWWLSVDAFRTYCLSPDSDCGSLTAECGVLLIGGGILLINPNDYLDSIYLTYCLGPDSDCGATEAECGGIIYDTKLLVNKGPELASFDYQTYCLAPDSDCGSSEAECGILEGLSFIPVPYQIPQNEVDWHFMIYVGAEIFGDIADVPAELQGEFERLLLSIMPYQQWMGLQINYV